MTRRIVFVDLLHVIAQFLENASVREVRASLLLAAVHDPGFLIGFLVAESVLREQAGSCSYHLMILLAHTASSEASIVFVLMYLVLLVDVS